MSACPVFDLAAAPDYLMITFDALRFDVAEQAFRAGQSDFLASLLPGGWECRHSPGNFTFAAHAALFAGFWPTPSTPDPHARPFALRFPGSRTTDSTTMMLGGSTIVEGLRRLGFFTICIGGVGFFNKLTPLGCVFPSLFDESYWQPAFAVSEVHSTRAQVNFAVDLLSQRSADQPVFLFINISATHPPTTGYSRGAKRDSVETQIAALHYVDRQLPALFDQLRSRRRGLKAFLMSDHGTLFGEDGYWGHRVGRSDVWNVPYGECEWGPQL
jgi:hypothetical protein